MSFGRSLGIIWSSLSAAQRRRLVVMQFVSVLMAATTVLGLAAVMTFLAVLAEPTLISSNPALQWAWQRLGLAQGEFLSVLGGGFILLLIASASLNVFGLHAAGRIAYSVGDRVREMLFTEYLRRDYLFHARVGAGKLMENVLNQADLVSLALLQGQLLGTNALLSLLVIGSIAYVNPGVALLGAIGVAAIYWIFYRTIRSRVERNGRRQHELGAGRIAVVEQALLGIKYVQIARAQLPFARRFEALTRALSHHRADTQFLAYFPRYLLECAAGAALIVCAAFASRGASSGVWLAQLSFIGFAGFRLLPAIQQIYSAFVFIRASQPAMANIAAELGACVVPARELAPPAHQPLAQGVDLLGVSFRYSAQGPLVLDNASLHIAAGSVTGIVGASGCGKTTLIDLILGLLTPTEGRIVIDGAPLDAARVASWQASIGYVPQDITVLDATVRENIAFGVEAAAIDDARVREVATLAGAVGFIESLPGGFEAPLSGVGGGLSGGQRQRIAIARALYRDPALLVLDEATNALDAETEAAIIDAVMRNRGTRTLLIVAHGAAVIGACERVLELRQGVLASRPVGVPDAGGRAAEYSRG